ncbi:MAG: methylcrotonoyl-CoA carboxylase, partial [Actinobacteria bacterium]|nr:methylcrotonoyl-CoA carboxylase [Actinomycetota bacterium]
MMTHTGSTLKSRVSVSSPSFAAHAAHHLALAEVLRSRLKSALAGGGTVLVDRHHARGKILVRDRIDLLVDPLTPFLELSPLAAYG